MSAILLENGSALLLQDGSKVLLEEMHAVTDYGWAQVTVTASTVEVGLVSSDVTITIAET